MTLVYRSGDLFSSTCPALGHGVNTLGRMGAGIAVEFRRRWPAMYDAYVEECRSDRLRPGGIFVYQAPDRLIVRDLRVLHVPEVNGLIEAAHAEGAESVVTLFHTIGEQTAATGREMNFLAQLGGYSFDKETSAARSCQAHVGHIRDYLSTLGRGDTPELARSFR